ncbi:MAG: UDP-glucose 6-dehydrogenase [Thermoplasmata archaeon]|nr:MAG: UDP-glucose 6-dehydrogenase [Thermoplasmata archaeon]RLF60739.1 MAG: UDP-glucose 6-dehydrogenase [Thermoplasmata archaeon]RLF80867.1 MAG: UDP-glucose 6-dehydrogenase [Thermococci archaeon]
MDISIIGTGYVGLVTGTCFAKMGNKVILMDKDKDRVEKIKQGILPIYEEGLLDIFQNQREKIAVTNDIKYAIHNSVISFICVGTPSKGDGSIDLSYVMEASREIGEALKHKKDWHLVVVKSTVLPGVTLHKVIPTIEKFSGKKAGEDFGIAMNPEFLREGKAVRDFLEPDRIVIGYYDEKSKLLLRELYRDFDCPILETSLTAAEMIKYASNSFLATKISFINEIGNICKEIGVDTYEVADGMGLDKRIGRDFLDSGIGWGGSCFPKDTKALLKWAEEIGYELRIIKSAIEVNERQPLKVIHLLKKYIKELGGVKIGILGLAFKPGTDDVRESRSIPVVKELLKEGAQVVAYDPKAMDNFRKIFPQIKYASSAEEVLNDCEVILILTKWDDFRKLNYSGKIVIDGRRILEAKTTAKIYEGVCW